MVVRSIKPMVPPLKNGDHLDADEFERRYESMPATTRAELINGVVYIMASPVRVEQHGGPHGNLFGWLSQYRTFSPGIVSAIDSTIRLDGKNQAQPDAALFIDPDRGGQARIDADGYLAAAPELCCEVAASSVDYDLFEKRNLYERSGVREYLVWRVLDGEIDWWTLNEGKFEPIPAGEKGVRKSAVFPGLWLDTAALLRGDLAALFETVRAGVATPEHADFVKRLNASAP
jgi:Uma2 family endonuclease